LVRYAAHAGWARVQTAASAAIQLLLLVVVSLNCNRTIVSDINMQILGYHTAMHSNGTAASIYNVQPSNMQSLGHHTACAMLGRNHCHCTGINIHAEPPISHTACARQRTPLLPLLSKYYQQSYLDAVPVGMAPVPNLTNQTIQTPSCMQSLRYHTLPMQRTATSTITTITIQVLKRGIMMQWVWY